METGALAADRELQQRLLGVGTQDEEEGPLPEETVAGESAEALMAQVYRVERGEAAAAAAPSATLRPSAPLSERWNMPATSLRQVDRRGVAARARWRADLFHPVRRAHRPHRHCRRHLRHQGPRAQFHPRPAQGARHSDAHGRSLHLAQALDRRRDAAPGREHASARQLRGFLRRSRPLGDGDGRGVRALDRARAAHRRHHFGRRFRRHDAGDGGNARAAGRHSEDHGVDRRRRRRARLCRRERRGDVSFGGRRSGPQLDHRTRARQCRARARRHDRADADARGLRGTTQDRPAGRSASPCSASPRPACRR